MILILQLVLETIHPPPPTPTPNPPANLKRKAFISWFFVNNVIYMRNITFWHIAWFGLYKLTFVSKCWFSIINSSSSCLVDTWTALYHYISLTNLKFWKCPSWIPSITSSFLISWSVCFLPKFFCVKTFHCT